LENAIILFAWTTTYSGHCTVRKGQPSFSGQHQEIPDSPEKIWTVSNPTQ